MAARGSWLQQLCGRWVDSCQFPVGYGLVGPFHWSEIAQHPALRPEGVPEEDLDGANDLGTVKGAAHSRIAQAPDATLEPYHYQEHLERFDCL